MSKWLIKILFLVLGIILPFFVLVCVPIVLTQKATNITTNSAILNGEVKNCGECCKLSVWFEDRTSTSYGDEISPQRYNSPNNFSNWSGTKSVSGSELMNNLTSSKTYTLTYYDGEGANSDSVTVYLSSPPFYVSLSAYPSSGCAPLNNVDLEAEVSGTLSKEITYYFDCENNGTWEKIQTSPSQFLKVNDICDYSLPGIYIAKVRVEREGILAEDTVQILVFPCYSKDLSLSEYVKNLSDGTSWKTEIEADPGEVLAFKIKVKSISDYISQVILKHNFSLPDKIKQIRNLKVENNLVSGDLSQGLNLGSFSKNQEKIVYFEIVLENSNKFAFGTTEILGEAQAQFDSNLVSDSVKIKVRKKAVAGAVTGITTGVKEIFLDFVILPLLISLAIVFLFRNHFSILEEWIEFKKRRFKEMASEKILEAKIAKIRKREFKE